MSENIQVGASYSKKVVVNIIRVESDQFEICKPKRVTTRKWVFGEKNKIIHFKNNSIFTMDL